MQGKSRVQLYLHAIALMMAAIPHMSRAEAIARIGPYRNRGKGRGSQHRVYTRRSKYMPNECSNFYADERRYRQILRGQLDISTRA